MRYTTHINNAKCLEWGLSLNLGCLFDLFNQLSSWAESAFVDGKTYYFITREKIIEELPLAFQKPDTVYRGIKTLVDKGLVDWVKVGGKDMVCVSQKGATWNVLTHSEINPTLGNKSEPRKNIRADSEINPSAYIDDNITSDNIPPYNPPKGKVTSQKSKNELLVENQKKQFDEIWKIYPKGHKGDKDRCFKAFQKVIDGGKATFEELLASVTSYSNSDKVLADDGKYTKGMAAWFNSGGYDFVYTHKIAEQEATEAQAEANAKALEIERKRREAEQRRINEKQDKVLAESRLKSQMLAQFLENKGYTRSSLAINNPKLYAELKQEFELEWAA